MHIKQKLYFAWFILFFWLVWSDDNWLREHAGETVTKKENEEEQQPAAENTEIVSYLMSLLHCIIYRILLTLAFQLKKYIQLFINTFSINTAPPEKSQFLI